MIQVCVIQVFTQRRPGGVALVAAGKQRSFATFPAASGLPRRPLRARRRGRRQPRPDPPGRRVPQRGRPLSPLLLSQRTVAGPVAPQWEKHAGAPFDLLGGPQLVDPLICCTTKLSSWGRGISLRGSSKEYGKTVGQCFFFCQSLRSSSICCSWENKGWGSSVNSVHNVDVYVVRA